MTKLKCPASCDIRFIARVCPKHMQKSTREMTERCLLIATLVAQGLMAAATYIHSNTACALQAAGRDFPGWPLFLTGHSMGGARHPYCACHTGSLLVAKFSGRHPEGAIICGSECEHFVLGVVTSGAHIFIRCCATICHALCETDCEHHHAKERNQWCTHLFPCSALHSKALC